MQEVIVPDKETHSSESEPLKWDQKLAIWLSDPKNVEYIRESCPTHAIMSGVMGGGLGALFGLFMSSMSTAAPYELGNPASNPAIASIPLRQQMKQMFKDMFRATWSTGRSFATLGFLFSGTECVIETARAKHDKVNTLLAGCVTGGLMGVRSGGVKGMAAGCAGMAAFSVAMETFFSGNGGKNAIHEDLNMVIINKQDNKG